MGETSEPPTADRLGANLRALRERAGLSQAAFAAAMTARGITWHQQTVGRIEAGEQQARFAEALAIAGILDVPVGRLALPAEEAAAEQAVRDSGAALRQHHEAAAAAVRALLDRHEITRRSLAGQDASPWPGVRVAAADVRARMRMYSLESAVAEGRQRHEQDFPAAEEDSSEQDAPG